MKRGEHGGIFFRLLFLLFFIGLVAVVYAARHPLMRYAAEAWVVDEPAAPSDAIIVLGDDNYAADRAFHAADLYRAGAAPVVVASGRYLRQNVSVADLMERDLASFGVPAKSIVKLMHRADNTREEAVEAERLIRARGWKSVIVATSNYHTRRARFIFGRVLPPTVRLRVSAARDSEFDPTRWWETRRSQKLFMTELAGYVVAWWELRGETSRGNQAAFVLQRASHRTTGTGSGPFVPRSSRIRLETRQVRWISGTARAHTIVFRLPGSPGRSAMPRPWLRSLRWGTKTNVA